MLLRRRQAFPSRQLQSVLGTGGFQPVPEASRKAARDADHIGWGVLALPELDADMGDAGDGGIDRYQIPFVDRLPCGHWPPS